MKEQFESLHNRGNKLCQSLNISSFKNMLSRLPRASKVTNSQVEEESLLENRGGCLQTKLSSTMTSNFRV